MRSFWAGTGSFRHRPGKSQTASALGQSSVGIVHLALYTGQCSGQEKLHRRIAFGLDPRGNRDEMVLLSGKPASLFNRSTAALIFAVKPVTASHAFGFVTGVMRFRLFHCL